MIRQYMSSEFDIQYNVCNNGLILIQFKSLHKLYISGYLDEKICLNKCDISDGKAAEILIPHFKKSGFVYGHNISFIRNVYDEVSKIYTIELLIVKNSKSVWRNNITKSLDNVNDKDFTYKDWKGNVYTFKTKKIIIRNKRKMVAEYREFKIQRILDKLKGKLNDI